MAVRSHLEGLWSAELIGSHAIIGIGVLIFEPVRVSQGICEEGRVLGGDRHYAHTGSYRVESRRVSGRLRIIRYDIHEDGIPLFEQDETGLEFHGTIGRGGHREVLDLELTGEKPEVPGAIGLRLTMRIGP